MNSPVKRKVSFAKLSPPEEASPSKKQVVPSTFPSTIPTQKVSRQQELAAPCNVLTKKGAYSWRTNGVESKELTRGFSAYQQSEGKKGISFYAEDLVKNYLEPIRSSQAYWRIYEPNHFAQQVRRYATKFRNNLHIEESKAGQRSKNILILVFIITSILCLFFLSIHRIRVSRPTFESSNS